MTGTYRLHKHPDTFQTLTEAMATPAPGTAAVVSKVDGDDTLVTCWVRSPGGPDWQVVHHHAWEPDQMTGWWSTEPTPDPDLGSSHATEGCECGEWEDGEWDPRCAALITWARALICDHGAHGDSFVRWLPPTETTDLGLTHTLTPYPTTPAPLPGQLSLDHTGHHLP